MTIKTSVLEKISDFTELPKDLITGMPKLTFIGSRNLQVDNYRGLKEYTSTLIRLGAKGMTIEIYGSGLYITRIEADTIFIEGHIEKTCFVTGKNFSDSKKTDSSAE